MQYGGFILTLRVRGSIWSFEYFEGKTLFNRHSWKKMVINIQMPGTDVTDFITFRLKNCLNMSVKDLFYTKYLVRHNKKAHLCSDEVF